MRVRSQAALVALLTTWLLPTETTALDLSGSLQVWAGPVGSETSNNDQLDQRYRLQLTQEISPWLTALAAYRYTGYSLDLDRGADFDRTTSEPRLGLLYSRPTFSARLEAQNRDIRSSVAGQDLDIRAFLANLDWHPSRGPRFILRLRDETNTLDPAVFPRDTHFESLNFNVLYERLHWAARYTYTDTRTSDSRTDFGLEDRRHELRATLDQRWMDGKISFSMDARGALVYRVQQTASDGSVNHPVPVRQGLYALDTSPAIGELLPSPGLIDGDRDNPVSPRIEIGGANTFRNIGVDLGVTRQLTELEVSVDRPSAPNVVWEVYESPDNLNWFSVPGVVSTFDGPFQRYVVRFPETTSRFFKAVNVTTNSAVDVAVTEIRAIIATSSGDRTKSDGDEYWITAMAGFQPWKRASLTVQGSTRKDLFLSGAGTGRSRNTDDYGAQLRIGLASDLELNLNYRYVDVDEALDPVLKREEETTGVNLRWRPLQTVDVLLSASRRDETEEGEPIRLSETYGLRALTDLLPRFRLVSALTWSNIDDPFFGFTQESLRWGETLEARPYDSWVIAGTFSYTKYDSTGGVDLTDRALLGVNTTWFVFPYLSVNGDWNYGRDNIQTSLSQRYGLNWAPGPKLTLTISYQQVDSGQIRRTSNSSTAVNYRLNRWMRFWFNASRSEFEQAQLATSSVTTLRLGVDIVF